MIGEDGFPLVEWWIVSRNGLYSRANRVESCDKKRSGEVEEKVSPEVSVSSKIRFRDAFKASLCFMNEYVSFKNVSR